MGEESPRLAGKSLSDRRAPRISIIGPIYPHRGGIAHYTACLARALAEKGCDVQVVAFRRLYPRWLFPGRSEFDPSARPVAFDAERILGPLNPWSWLRAVRSIGRFSPDLVVVSWWHSWLFPSTAFLLGWLRGVAKRQTVLLCHNIRSHDRGLADRLAWPFLARLPSAHIVHCTGDPEKIRRRNHKANVIRAPHPIYEIFRDPAVTRETARKTLGIADSDRVCLFFGLVRRYKGLDVAIGALDRLARRNRGIRLVVAGEFYDKPAPYRKMIEDSGLATWARIEDHYIPNEEVALYFKAADLLLAPYRSGSHSGVIQIARAFALPVVASNIGGIADLVEHGRTGLLVPPDDPAALADAIGRYFDENLGDIFRRNINQDKDRFSWSSLAETIKKLASGSP